ncbi:hypothetical protein IFM89_011937 [Coptis chinensis]|uniref:FBD domain-containing protein n=1 Tax=Coptis chinensis TaxID=261450 RepID=A0A835H4P7_9MAGN|nr:hypothetical protein IFM89_011937 [Coptis chinensis]
MDIKKMRLGKYGMFGIQLPTSVSSAASLTSLELVVVRFPQGDDDALPRLESMEFVDEYDRGGDCQVNVCTPKLKSFKFVGPCFAHVWLENTPCLVSADLDVYQIKYYGIDKDLYLERLVRIMTGMAYLKAVTMSGSLLKTLTKLPILGWIGFIFRNVKYVELTNQWDDETCICPIANILERLPHIEALALERNKILRGPYDMVERLPFLSHCLKHEELHKRCDSCICTQLESLPSNEALLWEKNKEMWLGSTNNAEVLPSECLFDCLKTIEIRNPQGSDDDLKLMSFLLKRAVALQKVIITTTGQLSIERMNKLTEFNETLSELPRASSSVLID